MKNSIVIDFFIAKLNMLCYLYIIAECKYAITFGKSPINTLQKLWCHHVNIKIINDFIVKWLRGY